MQKDLFTSDSVDAAKCCTLPRTLELNPGLINYLPNFLQASMADDLLKVLTKELDWTQPSITIAGKPIPIPRLQVWMGDPGMDYTYSKQKFNAQPWHPAVYKIKQHIESHSGYTFNSVLCNYYRDGQDSVSWHADDEVELGPDPIIASYSLGCERSFQFRRKGSTRLAMQIPLAHNSLLLMESGVQAAWQHQIAKSKRVLTPRINLTFRYRHQD